MRAMIQRSNGMRLGTTAAPTKSPSWCCTLVQSMVLVTNCSPSMSAPPCVGQAPASRRDGHGPPLLVRSWHQRCQRIEALLNDRVRKLDGDGSRSEADLRNAAGGSGSPFAGDHADPAQRRRVDDVGDLCELLCRWRPAKRSAGWGSPCDAQVNSRLRCCTGRILLLYWQQRGPHQLW